MVTVISIVRILKVYMLFSIDKAVCEVLYLSLQILLTTKSELSRSAIMTEVSDILGSAVKGCCYWAACKYWLGLMLSQYMHDMYYSIDNSFFNVCTLCLAKKATFNV